MVPRTLVQAYLSIMKLYTYATTYESIHSLRTMKIFVLCPFEWFNLIEINVALSEPNFEIVIFAFLHKDLISSVMVLNSWIYEHCNVNLEISSNHVPFEILYIPNRFACVFVLKLGPWSLALKWKWSKYLITVAKTKWCIDKEETFRN